jgi:hypothetical protein
MFLIPGLASGDEWRHDVRLAFTGIPERAAEMPPFLSICTSDSAVILGLVPRI